MFPESPDDMEGVSRCTADDLDELRAFQAKMYEADNRVHDRQRAEWLFSGHPSWPDEGLTIWVCHRDGRIVGTVAEVPFDVKVDDGYQRGSWGVELMVDPQWRGRGVGPALSETRRQMCRVSAGLSISDAAHRSALRRRSTEMGSVPMFIRPVDPRAILHWKGAPLPARYLAFPLVAPMMRLSDLADRIRTRRVDLVPVDGFDDPADRLWEEISVSYRVISRRDRSWLKWRFDECPDRDSYLRYYVLHHECLIGYLVLRLTSWNGRPALALIDYLAAPADVARLLSACVRVAHQFDVAAVLCTTLNAQARNAFRKVSFFRRRHQGIRFLAYTTDESLGRVVRNPAHWFITSADSDLD